MIGPLTGQITLAVYALLLAAGGLVGYLKAGSKPSLIAGSISALIALAALALSFGQGDWGVYLGLALAVVMNLVFGYRYAIKTRKFMPSGLLAAVSLVVFAVLALWRWS